jgi:hypothetical protein
LALSCSDYSSCGSCDKLLPPTRNDSFFQALFTVYFRVCQYLTLTRLFFISLLQKNYYGKPVMFALSFLIEKDTELLHEKEKALLMLTALSKAL